LREDFDKDQENFKAEEDNNDPFQLETGAAGSCVAEFLCGEFIDVCEGIELFAEGFEAFGETSFFAESFAGLAGDRGRIHRRGFNEWGDLYESGFGGDGVAEAFAEVGVLFRGGSGGVEGGGDIGLELCPAGIELGFEVFKFGGQPCKFKQCGENEVECLGVCGDDCASGSPCELGVVESSERSTSSACSRS
jgi:hypothetical protein